MALCWGDYRWRWMLVIEGMVRCLFSQNASPVRVAEKVFVGAIAAFGARDLFDLEFAASLDTSEALIAVFGDFAAFSDAADISKAFIADQIGGIGAIVIDLTSGAFARAGAIAAFARESLGARFGDLIAFDQELFGDAKGESASSVAWAICVVFAGLAGNVDASAAITKESGDTFVCA